MKIGDMLIENFLSIQSARIILGARGLVNVEGINLDDTSANSNGSGKSSAFDALCWCLWDETARGVSGDTVINREAKKGTRVDVELLEGDDQWKVIRHRKHKTGKNELHLWHYPAGAEPVNLTKGTNALTQKALEEILGCSFDVFKGAVYCGQEQMPDLPGMTDKGLKVLVEEAAGTTLLDKGHRIALDGLAGAKAVLTVATSDLTLARMTQANAERQVAETTERQAGWLASRDTRVASLIGEARAAAAEATTLAGTAKTYDRATIEAEIATCDARIVALDGEKDEFARLDQGVYEASVAVSATRAALNTAKRDAERIKARIDGLDHQVGCPCSGCARPYTAEDIAPAKAAAAIELRAAVTAAGEAKALADAAENAATLAREARDAFKAGMADVASILAARDAASAKLRALTDVLSAQAAWTKQARAKADDAARVKAETNPFDAALERDATRLAEARAAAAAAEEKMVAADEMLIIAQDVATVFSPAGVRAHVLDTVTPFLNDRTARYLGTLSDGNISATWSTLTKGAKGDLKEKFAIEVANDTGGGTFKALSGGEKRKVRVACALALQDLVASRATKPIELFVGDEIDDALDQAGLERLMTILEEKSRERGSVFVISHGDLKDWIRNTITVTKKDRVSTISEAA